MRKHLVVLSFFLALIHTLIAQPGQLLVKGYGKDLYLDHKVSPKEGLFAIGRMYNVNPKFIASYNKLDMAKGLTVGQLIHIPLTDTNFSQQANKGVPVYYTAGTKETLQKVSNVNNKVSLQNLRTWNSLDKDDLAAGKKLIVGFLVTGENAAVTATIGDKKETATRETPEKQAGVTGNVEQAKQVVKTETPKEEPKKEEPKKKEPVVAKPQPVTDISSQGYFKTDFEQQVRTAPVSKEETVTAGIFKMNTRIRDVKYYLLVDGVVPGTIVRVINPDNNKAIYAKVLGEMNGIRQNQGLDIRISNTAAATLGITETDKFIVKINY